MARSEFIVEDRISGTWGLFWIGEDGEPGMAVGDIQFRKEPNDADKHKIWRVNNAAKVFSNGEHDSLDRGYEFDTKTAALKAQRAANVALKNGPLEEWEAKALAAGWKPPKGWKKRGS